MELIDRTPPHNLEAEQAVLGALLLDPDALITVAELLKPEDFYAEGHRHLYRTILELSNDNLPIDLVTVTEALQRHDLLEKAGGASYLASLAGAVPTAANVSYYARIVADKSFLRALIGGCTQLVAQGYEDSVESERLYDQAEQLIMNLGMRRQGRSYRSLKEMLVTTLEQIEQLCLSKGAATGLSTGFEELDRYTLGLQNSDLILLAARPSMGKTSLALNIARNVAAAGTPVAVFSLEMSGEQIVQRLLCSEALIDQQRLRTGRLTQEDWSRLMLAANKLSEYPVYIDDTPAISVPELRSKARRLRLEHQIGLLVLDYLQLMQSSRRSENRVQEISEISRSLKSLARELDIPVLALSQLSRAVEQRGGDKRPMLSDLRESGSLEQDSDIVMFIYREEFYIPDTPRKGIADLIIAKQRNGPTGTVELAFLGEFTKFANLEKEEPPDFGGDPGLPPVGGAVPEEPHPREGGRRETPPLLQ